MSRRGLADALRAVEPTWLDRAIAYVAPAAGRDRLKARAELAAGEYRLGALGNYHGASKVRRAGQEFTAPNVSPDAALAEDLAVLRERSDDLFRNDGLARGAIEGTVTAVVGTGLMMQSRIDARFLGLTDEQASEWQEAFERHFQAWAESPECDLARGANFYQQQDVLFREALLGGDAFTVLPRKRRPGSPYSLKLQNISGARVATPRGVVDGRDGVLQGIQADADGAPYRCFILDQHPGNLRAFNGAGRWVDMWTESGRPAVLHHMRRMFAEQRRGEPYLAPVIEPLKQLSRYTEAEVMAAVISGMFTVFVRSAEGLDPQDSSDSTGYGKDFKLGNGAILELQDGDSVETANPSRPNDKFDPFWQAIVRQIGMALNIPFEVLIRHYTSSYTAARAAILDAWRFYRGRREWLATSFCRPAAVALLDELVAAGLLAAPGYFSDPMIAAAYQRTEWQGDAPGSIDPSKEAAAREKNLAIGVTTLAKESAAYDGSNWEDNHRQQAKERAARDRDGLTPASPVTATGGPSTPAGDPNA